MAYSENVSDRVSSLNGVFSGADYEHFLLILSDNVTDKNSTKRDTRTASVSCNLIACRSNELRVRKPVWTV